MYCCVFCLFFSFFFFKQKTAYEMLRSLVGSEMCIRDRCPLCRTAEVVRSLSPETITRLADLATLAATVLALSLIHI